jgi:hypothetical protein
MTKVSGGMGAVFWAAGSIFLEATRPENNHAKKDDIA